MADFPAIFTTDLQVLKKLRENSAVNMFYFAADFDSLKNLLERKRINLIFVKSCDFSNEIKELFLNLNCIFHLFDNETELLRDKIREFYNKTYLSDFFENTEGGSFNQILGISPEIEKLKYKILKTASCDLPVLITGETGTGKTLVANAIHELSGRRKNKILEVNITEIQDGLFESVLFGHEKGSFTGADDFHKGIFEEANSTTLFLDEIGELPLNLQAKLLRVIDKKEFFSVGASRAKKTDARLIFATNANFKKKIIEGKFRRDLYRRLKNLLIEIPPLRKRKQDIPLIAKFYMKKNGKGKFLSENAIKFLQNFDWPENIGQLETCLNRAIVFSRNQKIEAEDLEF